MEGIFSEGIALPGYQERNHKTQEGADDYWIVKLDANRNIIWDKTYGGTGVDRLTTIIETNDGGYLIGGSSDSNISGEKNENSRGDLDMWIIKTDVSGNIMWQKTFGGAKYDWVESIVKTADGGYILAGSSHSDVSGEKSENSRGLGDFWILKINSLGTIVWQKTIGGNNGDSVASIVASSDGNYIVGGQSTSKISGEKNQNTINNSTDVWILKINDNGQILWQKNIGGSSTEWLTDIKKTIDNGYILSVMSSSGVSGNKTEVTRGDRDYWIVKLNEAGNYEWDKTIGGDNADNPQSVVQGRDGGYVTVGWSRSDISGDKTENKSGLQDIWIVKLMLCSQNLSVKSNSPVCSGETIQFNASGGTSYVWTGPNGFTSQDQNPTILNTTASQNGKYNCRISGTGGCDDTLSLIVKIINQDPPTAASPQTFCIQQNATLSDLNITGQNIKWYNSLTEITELPNTTLLQNNFDYYASQTTNGCESSRVLINTQILTSPNCDTPTDNPSLLLYPKFFTPNGDSFNDTWNIQFQVNETNLTVKIVDRYGKFIKELTATDTSWDGTYNGQELPATDYWFVITRANGNEYKGHFSLKR